MSTPYSCLLNTASSCTAECQADLDLLAEACHAEDAIKWDGNGMLDSSSAAIVAPIGTTMLPAAAFALLASGVATVPTNTAHGVASNAPLALELGACHNASGVYPYYSPPPPPVRGRPLGALHGLRARLA